MLEREVARGELYHADEVFITGTAAEVCPVIEVDDHDLGRPRAGDAGASGALLRRHRGPRPALGRVARLRRGDGARAGREHVRHMSERVRIYDTTLRDGMQREGLSCPWASSSPWPCGWRRSASTYIEAGFPASNPKYGELFGLLEREDLGAARLAAFGMTRRRGVPAHEDPAIRGLAESFAPGRHPRRARPGTSTSRRSRGSPARRTWR